NAVMEYFAWPRSLVDEHADVIATLRKREVAHVIIAGLQAQAAGAAAVDEDVDGGRHGELKALSPARPNDPHRLEQLVGSDDRKAGGVRRILEQARHDEQVAGNDPQRGSDIVIDQP